MRNKITIHNYNQVHPQLTPWMCLFWNESLYRSGAKSRDTSDTQPDITFFSYVWPEVSNNTRKRTTDTTDVIAKKIGEPLC